MLKNLPIQQKLMTMTLAISGAVLLLTGAAYFIYEYYSYRQTAVKQLTVVSKIIAANSTAALTFNSREEAAEILSALKAEPHILFAALYDEKGVLFSTYPANTDIKQLPRAPGWGYYKTRSYIEGFEPVFDEDVRVGTFYIRTDLKGAMEGYNITAIIAVVVLLLSFLVAVLMSRSMNKRISQPILQLSETARQISEDHDYSIRASKNGEDELGVLTDSLNHMLTEIERQNKEIKSFNQQLEQKVIERTNDLADAVKELESFSYSVSHDLRAPLRRINIFISFFKTKCGVIPEEAENLLNSVQRNAMRMEQLIDDLLIFARTGKSEMVKSETDMSRIVHSICEDFKKDESRNITFKIAALPKANADPVTIRQVWVNLIGNAVKFTNKTEHAIIEIEGSVNKEEILFSVKDNGSGFDMSQYEKLFKPFKRLHSNTEFEGTGVGLASVERIISKHGGKTWAVSEGKGSQFYFTLPLT